MTPRLAPLPLLCSATSPPCSPTCARRTHSAPQKSVLGHASSAGASKSMCLDVCSKTTSQTQNVLQISWHAVCPSCLSRSCLQRLDTPLGNTIRSKQPMRSASYSRTNQSRIRETSHTTLDRAPSFVSCNYTRQLSSSGPPGCIAAHTPGHPAQSPTPDPIQRPPCYLA